MDNIVFLPVNNTYAGSEPYVRGYAPPQPDTQTDLRYNTVPVTITENYSFSTGKYTGLYIIGGVFLILALTSKRK